MEDGATDGNLSGDGSGHINQDVALNTIAQAESTRSFFLAQTLESTKTIPVVSAKLPLDTNATESNNPSQVTSTEDSDSDPSQHVISTEPSDSEASGEISSDGDAPVEDGAEGGDGSDEPDPANPTIASESTVIGSFEYRGITYAVEPGGESVAVVAADYAKLPSDFIEAQTIVLPSIASPDGIDYYSVTRIADDAFASLTAAAAAENGQDAGASSDIQAQAEACAYGDQATSEPAEGDGAAPQVISGVVSLSGDSSQHVISSDMAEASDPQVIPTEGADASSTDAISSEGDEADPTPHVISSGASEAGGVEKSRPSSEGEGEALTDSTAEGAVGITTITIPASITTIEEDAFTGFDTLQYVIVSEDNPNYSMYDGCLYDKPLSSLLLIPEGRLGAVWVAPSVTTVNAEVFSHCASVTIVYADPDSAACQLLQGSDLHNANGDALEIAASDSPYDGSKYVELLGESDKEDAPSIQDGLQGAISAETRSLYDASTLEVWKDLEAQGFTLYDYRGTNAPSSTVTLFTADGFASAATGVYSPDGTYKVYRGRTTKVGDVKEYSYRPSESVQVGDFEVQGIGAHDGDGFLRREYYDKADGLRTWMNYGNDLSIQICRVSDRRVVDTPVIAVHPTLDNFKGITVHGIAIGFPAPYDIFITYQGSYTDAHNADARVSGTWSSRSGSQTSLEDYSTGVEEIDSNLAYIGDPSKPEYYMPIPTDITSGYTFIGWNADLKATIETPTGWFYRSVGEADRTSASESMTLYAIYSKNRTITLDDSGGYGGEGAIGALNESLPLKKSVVKPTRDGYAFNGYYELREDGTRNYWYDPSGKLVGSADGGFSDDSYGYPLESDYTLYADWVRDVELDTQDETANDKVHVVWAEDLPSEAIASGACDSATGPAAHTSKPIPVPTRAGYEFNGYWSTPYDESDPDSNLYYEVVGSGSGRAVQPVASKTWDIDQDRLYAHWKYRIELDPNVVNSDDEDALGDSSIAYDMSGYAGGTDDVYSDDYGNAYAVTRSGDDEVVSIEAIYGSPIKLPTVKGRTGYDDTQTWGVAKTEKGVAEGTLSLVEGYTANGSDRSDIAQAPLSYHATDASDRPTFVGPSDYASGITLYADWSGKAKPYTVKLVSKYDTTSEGRSISYAPTLNGAEANEVTLTTQYYDAKLQPDASKLPGLASATVTQSGASTTHNNLRLIGFFTEPYPVYSANDPDFPTAATKDDFAMANRYIDGDKQATRALRDVGDGATVTLYALWGYPSVEFTFDLQDESIAEQPITLNMVPTTTHPGNTEAATVRNGKFAHTLTTNDQLPWFTDALANIKAMRPNYEFNGFWTTPYLENDASQQYYDKDGQRLYNASGGYVWDKSNDTETLYAHWTYKVLLNLNTYNSDKELVVADAAATPLAFGATQAALVVDAARTAQTDGSDTTTRTVSATLEDAAAPTDNTLTMGFITVVDGSPLQLPEVTDRRGYKSTRAWAVGSGSAGKAEGAIALNSDGFTVKGGAGSDCDDLAAPTEAAIVMKDSAADPMAFPRPGTDNTVMLFADWTDCAEKYWVEIRSVYTSPDASIDGFKVEDAATASQYVQATYDEVLDMGGIVKPTDASTDRTTGERTNLTLKGYFTKASSVADSTGQGKQYVTVDADGALSSDKALGRFAFREIDAAGQADVTVDENRTVSGKFNSQRVIVLFAWWTYSASTVTFDLQGGTINGTNELDLGNLTMAGVTSHDPVPALTGTTLDVRTAPQRANVHGTYVFNGFWNTKYCENPAEFETVTTEGGATYKVYPKRYYVAEGTSVIPDVQRDSDGQPILGEGGQPLPKLWEEYANDVTLYAHWTYRIEYDKNLGDVGDIAWVDYTAKKADNSEGVTRATVMLERSTDGETDGGADGEADEEAEPGYEGMTAEGYDKYGNRYVKSEVADGHGATTTTVTVTAIAGAPVMLPNAYDRKAWNQSANGGSGAFVRSGYNKTNRWLTDVRDRGSAVGYDEADEPFTTKAGSWVSSSTLGGKSIPCAVGQFEVGNNNLLTLHADWEDSKQTLWVELMFNYDTPNGTDPANTLAYGWDAAVGDFEWGDDYVRASSAGNPVMKVRYDERFDALAAGVTKATAHTTIGEEAFENLDFAGIRTAGNDFRSGNVAGIGLQGDEYVDASGTCIRDFRFVSDEQFETNTADDPNIKLYVYWVQPKREVSFNLFDEDAADAIGEPGDADYMPGSTISATKFTLQKGDGIAAKEAAVDSELSALASELKSIASREGYVFGGFWNTPYQETSTAEVTPACYYVLNDAGDKLVAATRENAPWVSSDANIGTTWREDEATVLYAHWKYRVKFVIDDGAPKQGDATPGKDYLLIGSAVASESEPDPLRASSAREVTFANREFTDEMGYVTFGAPLTLPYDQSGKPELAVKRVRDFSDPALASYGFADTGDTGFGYTGYDFAGWWVQGASGAQDVLESELVDHPSALVPQDGLVTLHAKWDARTYDLALVRNSSGFAYNGYQLDQKRSGDPNVHVTYDQPIDANATKQPHLLYGYDFNGYFGKENGAGACYYTESRAADDGLSQSTTVPWMAPVEATGNNSKHSSLYAHYTQQSYTVSYLLKDDDGTTQPAKGEAKLADVEGKLVAASTMKWHYGDRFAGSGLTTKNAKLVFPMPGATTFSRDGYSFVGWYFYADPDADHSDESARTYLFRANGEGGGTAGYFTENSNYDPEVPGSQQWVLDGSRPGYFDGEGDLTLYAAWTPNRYTVTYHSNFPDGRTQTSKVFAYEYEQVLTVDDIYQVGPDGAPYELFGYNTSSSAKADATASDTWLYDFTDREHPQVMIADESGIIQGGRFMPKQFAASAIDFHAVWKTLENKNMVLFQGNFEKGALRNDDTLTDCGSYAWSNGYTYEHGVDLNTATLQIHEKPGYDFKGWVQLSAGDVLSLVEDEADRAFLADRGDGTLADMTRDQARAFAGKYANAINALDVSGDAYKVMNPAIRPSANKAQPYKDYFLVAKYELKQNYSITLDLGSKAEYEQYHSYVPASNPGGSATEKKYIGPDITGVTAGFTKNADPALTQIQWDRSFSTEGGTFTIPDPSSEKFDFLGWTRQPGEGGTASNPYLSEAEKTVVCSQFVADADGGRAPANRTLHAHWKPKEYTVVFEYNRFQVEHEADGSVKYDEDNVPVLSTVDGDAVSLNESDVWQQVGYDDTFSFPWPATRGEGYAFRGWGLYAEGAMESPAYVFAADETCDLENLVFAINNPSLTRFQGESLGGVSLADNRLVLRALWGRNMSVTMPLLATVSVDPTSGDMLSGQAYVQSRFGQPLEVVSLRYDKLDTVGKRVGEADAAGSLFDTTGRQGSVHLTVYAGLEFADGFSPSNLLLKGNVLADGTLAPSVKSHLTAGADTRPLRIDLASESVITKTLPFGVDGTTASAYVAESSLGTALDRTQTLSEAYGFRPFASADRLPLYYGLLFDGADVQPETFADLVALGPDGGEENAIPIAHLYYTVAPVSDRA